jgi:hypothetical protein
VTRQLLASSHAYATARRQSARRSVRKLPPARFVMRASVSEIFGGCGVVPTTARMGAPLHSKRRWYPAPTCKTASGVCGDGMVSTRRCGAQPNRSLRHAPVCFAPEKHPAIPRSWGPSRGRGRGPDVVESTPCCAITPRAVETEMWAARLRTDAFMDRMDRSKGALVLTSHPAKVTTLCRVRSSPSRPRSLLSTCRHGGSPLRRILNLAWRGPGAPSGAGCNGSRRGLHFRCSLMRFEPVHLSYPSHLVCIENASISHYL